LGGGIFSWNSATLNVNTCTVVSNTASGSTIDAGGGIINSGTLTIRDSTIAYNQADYGGGLCGPADLGNTILAGNSASSLPHGPDAYGSLVTSDYNLVQKTNGITFSGLTTHNITGQSPLLGPLQYNGGQDIGYQLLTMAPLAGSPAIDNGKTSSSTDERGFNRPYDTDIYNADGGNGGDIGAFEVYPNNLYVINNNDSGPGSLRQAILDNDGLGGGNSIYFSSNVVGTITLTSGSLVMNMSGQIFGPGAKVLAVSGNHNGRVFDIRNGPTAISGLTIRDGLVVGMDGGGYGYPGFDERGGGILSQYSLLLSNCVVCSNSVVGGIGGSATVGPGGNGGKASGGGLYSSGNTLILAYCLFDGNTCTGGKGGSAANHFGGFGGNGLGAAMSTLFAPAKIIGCEFRNGLAKGGDGGSGNPSGNGGQGYGGGIYSEITLAISDSTIAGNTAAGGGGSGQGTASGGGAYSSVAWGFTNCTIANNTATGSFSSGGGLWSQASLMVFNCTVTGNQAEYGGGIAGNPTLGNTIVAGNTAAIPADGPDGSRGCSPLHPMHPSVVLHAAPANDPLGPRSARRREELEGDVVRVAERQTRTVARVYDLAVGHAQRVQAGRPLGQFGAARAAERHMVQARPPLVELVLARQVRKAVQPEHGVVAERVDDVTERSGVLVEDRADAEDPGVPGLADRQVGHGHGDVRDGREGS
jgi:hypothetical protein